MVYTRENRIERIGSTVRRLLLYLSVTDLLINPVVTLPMLVTVVSGEKVNFNFKSSSKILSFFHKLEIKYLKVNFIYPRKVDAGGGDVYFYSSDADLADVD